MSQLNKIVRTVLSLDPHAPAIECNGAWTTWGEITAVIDAVEEILKAEGIGGGTRIGGILPSSITAA